MHLHQHDPFRGAQASAPQIPDDAEPKTGALRIVAWTDRYPPWPGAMAGGEMALHGMLKPLAARGHDVAVCTHSHPGGGPVDFDGITVWPETEIERLLDGVDVLLGQLLWTKHTRRAAVQGQVPFVYLFHNDFTIPHWKLHPQHVTAAVFNTRWICESTLRKHPVWASVRSTVVRPPVHLADYQVEGPGWEREFVTLVNPNQAKGGQQLYKIAERRRQLRFLAVEGAYGHQIRPKRGVHKHVEWQPQTADMRSDVYARTRVLLVPSDYESFGRVAVEAAASGAVAVVSETDGLREAMGPSGLFAPVRDIDRWLHWLDALGDREVYEAAQRAQQAQAELLAAESVGEIDALEDLLRLAANAERVASPVMGGHDPFRKRHGRSVEVGEAPQRPSDSPEPVPAPVVAGEAETATQAGVWASDTATLADVAGAPVVVGEHPDGSRLEAFHVERPATITPTEKGAGADGESAGGDTGHSETTPAQPGPLDATATGDGAPSHDEGQPSPEPAPATQQGDAPGDAALPAEPGADPARPRLADQVPPAAVDARDWIREAASTSAAEQYDRAEAAEWVELRRDGKRRKTVMDAVAPILYED